MGTPEPGRGHRALARLAEQGRLSHVITQNIDGLHQASGLAPEQVIELHGNGTYAHCLDCGRRHELDWVAGELDARPGAPHCLGCGGIVKTATISFGQAMPLDEMQRAEQATLACDLFLAIGSSLVVYPAAGFPMVAKRNGARLVIVNREPTELDGFADLVVHQDIGDVLEVFSL
jgi:NAD-dependent deacetylase